MSKVLIFDYDGTFYRSKEEIKINIESIKKARENGHIFVVATGRSYSSFMKEVDKFGIVFDYLILCSGGLILDHNHHIIHAFNMDHERIDPLRLLMNNYQDLVISNMFISTFINSKIYDKSLDILKVTYNFPKVDIVYQIKESIQASFNDVFKVYVIPTHTENLVEIISNKTDKAVAIEYLLNWINKKHDIIVAGDSENDLEMIEAFNGYLMSNYDRNIQTSHAKIATSIQYILSLENII